MTDFDQYAADYTDHVDRVVKFSGQDTDFFHDVKVDLLLSILSRSHSLNSLSVLDIGCGTGSLAARVAPWVGELFGVDTSESSIRIASARLPGCRFNLYDGKHLPFEDDSLDFAFASCVMHHVPPEQWADFVEEMQRVIRPGGCVAVVEHNPWNPLTRLAVSKCEFDDDAVLLSRRRTTQLLERQSLRIIANPFILFFPWRWKLCRSIERLISQIPFGAQYIVIGEKWRMHT